MPTTTSTISVEIKNAMATALSNLTPATDGTEIQDVVLSGEDAFDEYPVIRIVPQGFERTINSENRYLDYTINYVISVYLDMGDDTVPDKDIINTLQELADKIMDKLDNSDWLPSFDDYDIAIVENATNAVIDTTQTKTGTALYCDIVFPVSYRRIV